MTRLFPVVQAFSTRLARRERVGRARSAARAALQASAARAGAPAHLSWSSWPRDEDGAPASLAGWHVSLSDTAGLAAAIAAPVPVALDVEWLGRPRWEVARERFRAEGELTLLGADDSLAVLSLWTAKEALLKLRRVGLADLGRCSLVRVTAQGEFVLLHGAGEQRVRVQRAGDHLLALACDEAAAIELGTLAEVA